MLIKNVRTLDEEIIDLRISTSQSKESFDAEKRLLLLPALIDPHFFLGSDENKEIDRAESSLQGGFSEIIDLSSLSSSIIVPGEFKKKKMNLEEKLSKANLLLRFHTYVKANSKHVEDFGIIKDFVVGSLIQLRSDDVSLEDKELNKMFQLSAWKDLPMVIHLKNENQEFKESSLTLLERSIFYTEKHDARLYVMNVSTQEEMNIIQKGREKSLLIYTETTPSLLYPSNASKADFLWNALKKRIIETLGTGYLMNYWNNDQALTQNNQDREILIWRGNSYLFSHPIFFLPLLLTAFHENKISLENIVRLTRVNFYDIFKLKKETQDFILVDLEKEENVQRIDLTGTSHMTLKGWPEYICVKGNLFKLGTKLIHL